MSRPHAFAVKATCLCVVASSVLVAGGEFLRAQTPGNGRVEPTAVQGVTGETALGSCVKETRHYTLGEILEQSLCGEQPDPCREWTPLCAGSFFTEGWCEPWNAPPGSGTGGSLRQGWIGTPDAFFNRMVVGIYADTDGTSGADDQFGALLLENPINRRWMVGALIPFAHHIDGSGADSESTDFGDVTIVNRFMVQETKDMSLSFNFNVRTPTGDEAQGNDRTRLQSYFAYYFDVGCGVSIRGASGLIIPVDDQPTGSDVLYTQSLAIGQTITDHDVPLLGDFTYYAAANLEQSLENADNTFVSITPGIRTHLGNNWFFLAGVEMPVNGPRAFDDRLVFVLVKGY